MKKIVTLLGAVALVAGASAQVKQLESVGAPFSVKEKLETSPLIMNPAGATKAGEMDEDTIYIQVIYDVAQAGDGSFYTGYSVTGISKNDYPNWQDAVGQIPSIFFTVGSGWASCKYGSGEFGYSFDFTRNGWYEQILRGNFRNRSITGAIALVGRAPSSDVSMTADKKMPLHFKLYSSAEGQVTEQEGFVDMTSNDREKGETQQVFYPNDPTKYYTVSDTVMVGLSQLSEKKFVIGDWYGARFAKPALAGEHPCISVVFPTERNASDSLWNATLYEVGDGTNQTPHSRQPASMYAIYDFDYQGVWANTTSGEYLRERTDGFVPDSMAQPNARYAVVPLSSWHWTDANGNANGQQDGEIALRLIMAKTLDVERGASYDKYVEVKINPAIDYTVIQATDRINKVEIFNMSGKLVKAQVCNSNNERIELNGLTSGMYIAKVTTEAGVANKKIMVR